MTKYIAKHEGQIVGTRTSDRTYTHAIVTQGHGKGPHVATWCGRFDLAQGEKRKAERYGYTATIVEVEVVGFVCNGALFNTFKEAQAHAGQIFKTTGVIAGVERT